MNSPETLIATAATLPNVGSAIASQFSSLDQDALYALLSKEIPLVADQRVVDNLLIQGFRRCRYRTMDGLWLDIQDTGFDQSKFPFNVHRMEEGYSLFIDEFWSHPYLVRRQVLIALAAKKPVALGFRKAVFTHSVFTWSLSRDDM